VVTSCGFIDFTFALLLKIHLRFRGSFFWRFHSMARQLCGAAARASARLSTIYFFLPHFGAIKVRKHSLLSNVFRILRTTVIKISLFFILDNFILK